MTTKQFPLSLLTGRLSQLRASTPLVHCLTNEVVQDITANILMAAGAAPAMVIDAQEAPGFAAISSAVLINIGTLTVRQADAMLGAIESALDANKPWVLDPVAVGVIPFRTQFAIELLSFKPAAIRGNASEILTLAGQSSTARGVDSLASSETALAAAQALAQKTGAVVAVTGATDYITDAVNTWAVPWGDPMLTRVTGTGCSLSALVAAFCALPGERLDNVAAACALMAVAGEKAARATRAMKAGVGSFRVNLLDAIDLLNAETIEEFTHV